MDRHSMGIGGPIGMLSMDDGEHRAVTWTIPRDTPTTDMSDVRPGINPDDYLIPDDQLRTKQHMQSIAPPTGVRDTGFQYTTDHFSLEREALLEQSMTTATGPEKEVKYAKFRHANARDAPTIFAVATDDIRDRHAEHNRRRELNERAVNRSDARRVQQQQPQIDVKHAQPVMHQTRMDVKQNVPTSSVDVSPGFKVDKSFLRRIANEHYRETGGQQMTTEDLGVRMRIAENTWRREQRDIQARMEREKEEIEVRRREQHKARERRNKESSHRVDAAGRNVAIRSRGKVSSVGRNEHRDAPINRNQRDVSIDGRRANKKAYRRTDQRPQSAEKQTDDVIVESRRTNKKANRRTDQRPQSAEKQTDDVQVSSRFVTQDKDRVLRDAPRSAGNDFVMSYVPVGAKVENKDDNRFSNKDSHGVAKDADDVNVKATRAVKAQHAPQISHQAESDHQLEVSVQKRYDMPEKLRPARVEVIEEDDVEVVEELPNVQTRHVGNTPNHQPNDGTTTDIDLRKPRLVFN